jgi:hypothetical protein
VTDGNPLPSAEDCQLAISSRQEGSCHDTELCALQPRRVSGSLLAARSCRRRCSRPRHPKHRCALSASQCQGPREFPLLRRRKFSIALTADRCSRSKGQGMLRHATVKHLSSTEGLLPTPEQAVLIRKAIGLKRRKRHPGNVSHLHSRRLEGGFQRRQRARRERLSLSIP